MVVSMCGGGVVCVELETVYFCFWRGLCRVGLGQRVRRAKLGLKRTRICGPGQIFWPVHISSFGYVWSPAPRSMTLVCQHFFMVNCTGLTSLNECSTSLPWPSTGVSGIKYRRTSLTTAFQCLMLPAPVIRQPPSTDCSTCPLQHLWLSLLHFCWSYSLKFTAWQSAQFSCWARPVLTDSENPPVCLL